MPTPRKSTPVACKICGRMINRAADMARHLDTHSLDKEKRKIPCTWPDCSFRTLQKSNMKIHMNRHCRLFPYKCLVPGCGFKSADPASLNRHERRRHGHPRRRTSGRGTSPVAPEITCRERSTSPESTIPESCPSSSHLCVGDHLEEGSKNMLPAFDSELVVKQAQAYESYDALFVPTPGIDHACLTSNLGALSAPEVPMAMHPYLFIPDQHDYYAFEGASQTVSDGTVGDCTVSFHGWLPQAGPLCNGPSPLVQHAFDNPTATTSATLSAVSNVNDPSTPPSLPLFSHTVNGSYMPPPSLPPSQELKYSVNNTFAPAPTSWSLPGPEVWNASSNYAYNGLDISTAFFEDHSNLPQVNMFATPNLGMGVYPQLQPQAIRHGPSDVNADYQTSDLYATFTDTAFGDGMRGTDLETQGLHQWDSGCSFPFPLGS